MDLTATTKSCSACEAIKPHAEFGKDRHEKSGLKPACRACQSARKRSKRATMTDEDRAQEAKGRMEYYYRSDQVTRNRNRRSKAYHRDPVIVRLNVIKGRFGLSHEDFAQMRDKQDNRCAICKQPETINVRPGKVFDLAVDHDHATGKVRGLLCAHCNRALGGFKDDPSLLLQAVKYLEKHSQARSAA